jgi:hypothetical protein
VLKNAVLTKHWYMNKHGYKENAQRAITASHELPHYSDLYGSKKLPLELEVILWYKLA